METAITDINDFDKFYDEKLLPSMEQLRAECRATDNWGYIIFLSGILGFGSFLLFNAGYIGGNGCVFLVVCFGALLFFSVYKYANKNDRFTEDYKSLIIKEIISHVCPGMIYKPDESVKESEYKASCLLRYYYDSFDGDDYMEGTIDNINVHCSELLIETNDNQTVFKGLFIVAKISSAFTGGTYAWARSFEQLPESIADDYYHFMPMPRIADVHFADPEFNEYFRVCTTYTAEAKEILSDEMRKNMASLGAYLDGSIAISFVAGKCYIAIPFPIELLEPSDYDPGDKIEIKKYFDTIGLVIDIVKRLELNRLS